MYEIKIVKYIGDYCSEFVTEVDESTLHLLLQSDVIRFKNIRVAVDFTEFIPEKRQVIFVGKEHREQWH